MGTYLIDTNVVIDLFEGRLPLKAAIWVDNFVLSGNSTISVINKIELLGFNSTPNTHQNLVKLINSGNVLSLTDSIVDETIALKKMKKIKLPDAVIAATALVHKLTIISRNKVDFNNIPGLICLDPYVDI
jgi:toxin FitB